MAANESVNNDCIEAIINRWILDYYGFQALDAFEKDKYEDFCSARDIIDKVLDRPVQNTDTTKTKIWVLRFLSRINEGEHPGTLFDCEPITPLESALTILDNWQEDNSSHEDLGFEKVRNSVKEMLLGILIKNKEFNKAKEVLNKYFPKPIVGKRATFMTLIRQRNNKHKVIEQMDFHYFKEEMLAFCKTFWRLDVPFLYKAAKQANDTRLEQQEDMASDDEGESGPSSSPQLVPCKNTIIPKTRLQAAYQALATGSDEKSFSQLEEEVEREGQSRTEECFMCLSQTPNEDTAQKCICEEAQFQRQSGSPMEASPADQPQQTHTVQTGALSKTPSVAQLVILPDSQPSSQCTTDSQEVQTGVTTQEPAESPVTSSKNDQCPVTEIKVTKPTRKLPRRADKTLSRASTSLAELSEEEPSVSVSNRGSVVGKVCNQSNASVNRSFIRSKESDSEEAPKQHCSTSRTPVRKRCERLASNTLSKDPGNRDEICITDSSLDSSPNRLPADDVPQTSSTPHKVSPQDSGHSKWKQLFKEAKETKETWSDEDSYVNTRNSKGLNESTMSNSGHRKRRWTDLETEKLKEGVKRYGEGNWRKIQEDFKFKDRTNVDLKDKWRNMKKSKMV